MTIVSETGSIKQTFMRLNIHCLADTSCSSMEYIPSVFLFFSYFVYQFQGGKNTCPTDSDIESITPHPLGYLSLQFFKIWAETTIFMFSCSDVRSLIYPYSILKSDWTRTLPSRYVGNKLPQLINENLEICILVCKLLSSWTPLQS